MRILKFFWGFKPRYYNQYQDIIILINISLTEIIPTEYQNLAGDINQDGTIDILDIINCINIILNR